MNPSNEGPRILLVEPEPLLGETPRAIADLMLTYLGTLRYEFDDVVCGALVRGTMTTELSRDPSLAGRINRLLERSFSKTYFVKNFVEGDFARAAAVGVRYTTGDKVLTAIAALAIFARLTLYDLAARVPALRDAADAAIGGEVRRRLKSYGHGEFVSNAEGYRPALAA